MHRRPLKFPLHLFLAVFLLLVGTGFSLSPEPRTNLLISTQDLADRMSHGGLIIVHVEKDREGSFAEGHIPGAHRVTWTDVAVERDGIPNEIPSVEELVKLIARLGIQKDSAIVVYDDGAGLAAARAYVVFDYLGLGDSTAVLDGQLAKWQAEERPIFTDEAAPGSADYIPHLHPEVIVSLDDMRDIVWLKQHFSGANPVLIDARPEFQYHGDKPGKGIDRPGHIPEAHNIFWRTTLTDSDVPVMKSIHELRRMYEAAGANRDSLVVAYCRTGGQASQTYFTAKYLGYDVRLYDGSFIEWSHAEGTDVIVPMYIHETETRAIIEP
ncbi:hypothetical protein KQI84_06015 [bacterium]|nr:hypothetical protein [bacterium]